MSNSPGRASLVPSPSLQDAATGSRKLPSRQASPNVVEQQAIDPEPTEYVEPDNAQLLPPANFAPFFTVIEDTATGEHYHPSVHYIFSDDDQEIITAAAMRELGYDDSHDEPQEDDRSDATITILPPTQPGVKERYLLLDISPDGQTVAETQSMSRDWQVTDTDVCAAPTWDADSGSGNSALMLKIGGVEISHSDAESRPSAETLLTEARNEASGDLLAALDSLSARFDKELGALTRLLDDEPPVEATRAETQAGP
ncbi:hypothetical protein EJ05DRAFT_230454 [Pseudovirgaria hyperparasitica]|uniref:Uncharacterized protein n=1 Tax=Pseudovirgaria hyperparasitica TaxID=470096 RepID=A0A6A6VUT7_9PEZI|nr:uncharacterized protein EJ05DRAFT_230454 [Pseudovirgaria hyperparasitica]KAF2753027.1 hypothetical protein EJ05DRAFT_230454 [Pseudovirgaria hyperparasitica]